ncbi:hypothetical protein KCG44_08750 [Pacificimonas sp. WHA3]|uniref:Uncharacterized protein n=1 Tax=Pacificimonas pallii TaxID=2827236 RepID=A0ABS6SEN5_9SPHN|nr:hypothetical protein [Pacificimonas pallii]MBV7256873.1 hypothetical protein [Pacificimonas pallii]
MPALPRACRHQERVMKLLAIGLAALALANGAAANRVQFEKQDIGRVPAITLVIEPDRFKKAKK